MPKGPRKFELLVDATGLTRFGGLILFYQCCKSLGVRHFLQLYARWPSSHHRSYQTGDLEFLLEPREYFRDPQRFRCLRRDPRWSEADGFELRTKGRGVYRGSVFEHLLVQTLTAFFNVGEHGLCRLEGADWNDGLDMAAHRGESVAFSAFYAWNLERLARTAERLAARGLGAVELAEELGLLLDRLPGQRPVPYRSSRAKQARLEHYLEAVSEDLSGRRIRVRIEALARDLRAKHLDLARRIRGQEWIAARGHSFFNGYYDDLGRRVEGDHRLGLRMTLTGQVFPLMSGIATEEQVDAVIRSVNRFLRDPRSGGVRLNTDFGAIQPRLGRAFSFAYGEKENGAVFSHMDVMYAAALYARRRAQAGRRVWRALYEMAVNQPAAKIFPGLPEYFNAEGRGMYCYLTGSASWLILLLLTRVYGVRGELGDLIIDPQLTPEDFAERTELRVQTIFADRPLLVRIANPHRLAPEVYRIERIHREREPVPFKSHPAGGIVLKRETLLRWPTAHPTTLRVILGHRSFRNARVG